MMWPVLSCFCRYHCGPHEPAGLIRLRGHLPSLASFLGLLRLIEKVAGREHPTRMVQRLQPFGERECFSPAEGYSCII